MVAVSEPEPPFTPDMTPPPLTVATPVLLLLHVPPGVVLLNVVVCPIHTVAVPVIVFGSGLTVTVLVSEQDVGSVYTMFDVPGVNPVSIPEPIEIVAVAGVVLVHVPPAGIPVSVVVLP